MKKYNRNDVLTIVASHLSAVTLTKDCLIIIEVPNDYPFHAQISGCKSVEVITHQGFGSVFNFTFSEVVNEQHEIRWDSTNKVWYNNKK